jgi:hypothetical protein
VELRVDVDGENPTHRISADYFRVVGDAEEYLRSMRVDAPRVTFGPDKVTITGTAAFTEASRRTRIRVTIPHGPAHLPPPPATLEHHGADGSRAARYVVQFQSSLFRRVELEEASERGVPRFESYDTGALASGGPARTLSSVAAFREAGIEMISTTAPKVIDTSVGGPDSTWSDAELHAAMEATFTRWADRPEWAIWMLHAADHDDPQIGGLMFDRHGAPRQGCAIFYGSTPRSGPEALRNRVHACVHELGHGFNLLHSWQKSLAIPPVPSRPDALSWMNYPERFPGATARFWSRFPFVFDEPELVHLRHGFYNQVIMGGAALRGGAALGREENWSGDRQDPGLRLKLTCAPAVSFGVPITAAAVLSTTSAQGRDVPPVIGPQSGTIDILIRSPRGEESVFVPLLRHCRGQEPSALLPPGGRLRSQPYIHYGQNGFSFSTPGRYTLRARYAGNDGRAALSNAVSLQVLAPVTRADREVESLMDDGVATLLTLLGSDAPELRSSRDALQEIVERHPAHPAAAAARLAIGTNLARSFKLVAPDGRVSVRPACPMEAAALIESVIDFAAVQRLVPIAATPEVQRRAVAAALLRVGTRPGVPASVGGFIASRRYELSAVREVLKAGAAQLRSEAARTTRPTRLRTTYTGGKTSAA